MTVAYNNFLKNMESIFELDHIYCYLSGQVTAINISELLRAEYVLAISALDNYVHEVVREGLLKRFNDVNPSEGLSKISIPLDIVKVMFSVDEHERLRMLSNKVKEITSKDSYQSPKGIENALCLIDISKLWSGISTSMSDEPNKIKARLSLLVQRRNKIAHESDINYMTGLKEEIDRDTVLECIDFVKRLVMSIDLLIDP